MQAAQKYSLVANSVKSEVVVDPEIIVEFVGQRSQGWSNGWQIRAVTSAPIRLWQWQRCFVGGMLTASNPCVLVMIPLMISFVAGRQEEEQGVFRAFVFSLVFRAFG